MFRIYKHEHLYINAFSLDIFSLLIALIGLIALFYIRKKCTSEVYNERSKINSAFENQFKVLTK